MALDGVTLPEFTPASAVDTDTFFVGFQVVSPGVYEYTKYTSAQLLAALSASTSSNITVGADGAAITDVFFSNTIRQLVVGGTMLLAGQDFTQSGTTITITNGTTVYTGQIIAAFI